MDVAGVQNNTVCGFVTEIGGSFSHAAIMAKAKNIPYVTGIDLKWIKQKRDSTLILDSISGKIIINPTAQTLLTYQQLKVQFNLNKQDIEKVVPWPSETFDGYAVKLLANLDGIDGVEVVSQMGGEGVGLLRSEYLFLTHKRAPTEEEQFHCYCKVLKIMEDKCVTIRTFDLSGDKWNLQAHTKTKRERISKQSVSLFERPELLKTQIRAILRASLYGNLQILFPMLSTLSELREGKKLIRETAYELGINSTIRVGCMIEVPSVAFVADHFAGECDFLSLGTNDLVQYALARDRGVQRGNAACGLTDPSILRLIRWVTVEAERHGIPICMCGEMAADPRYTALLLGLGVHEFSVALPHLAIIKSYIRRTSIVDAVHMAEQALHLKSSEEVQQLLENVHESNKN